MDTILGVLGGYSPMTQLLVLVGLVALWVLFFSLEDYFRYQRSVRVTFGLLSFVAGLIVLLMTILMVISIVKSEATEMMKAPDIWTGELHVAVTRCASHSLTSACLSPEDAQELVLRLQDTKDLWRSLGYEEIARGMRYLIFYITACPRPMDEHAFR